jgi:hypothetical protein
MPVHHDEYEIRLTRTDLETDASAFHADGRWRGPAFAVLCSARELTLAVLGADDEPGPFQIGHDSDALRLLQ